ncbi:hypothetical protein SAMN05216281_101316 [Cryobacterium luteum]|nr:hypothetical protein SAMN05216281_101316 [Cryobacterium luteum]
MSCMIHIQIPKAKAAKDRSHTVPTTPTPAPFPRASGQRWRVERAGAARGIGYGLGWYATCVTTEVGAFFPTHAAALAFANEQAAPTMEPTC